MSLLVMAFYWIVFPWGVFKLARWLLRKTHSPVFKKFVVVATIGIYTWFLWIAIGQNMWLDHQVDELCAKDGGVKIYETVELTPDLILKNTNRIWLPDKEDVKPSDKYYYEIEYFYYRKGNPDLSRRQSRIIRQSDGKVLGESISYSRGGGGLPGPWHGSSYDCPEPSQGIKFENAIFIKGDNK